MLYDWVITRLRASYECVVQRGTAWVRFLPVVQKCFCSGLIIISNIHTINIWFKIDAQKSLELWIPNSEKFSCEFFFVLYNIILGENYEIGSSLIAIPRGLSLPWNCECQGYFPSFLFHFFQVKWARQGRNRRSRKQCTGKLLIKFSDCI